MARGIRLKELRSTHLKAIGVPDDGLTRATEDESKEAPSLLAQADPVLSQALDEVRRGLEATLQHLSEALSASSSAQGPPPTSDE
jgi:hypothetical protein